MLRNAGVVLARKSRRRRQPTPTFFQLISPERGENHTNFSKGDCGTDKYATVGALHRSFCPIGQDSHRLEARNIEVFSTACFRAL